MFQLLGNLFGKTVGRGECKVYAPEIGSLNVTTTTTKSCGCFWYSKTRHALEVLPLSKALNFTPNKLSSVARTKQTIPNVHCMIHSGPNMFIHLCEPFSYHPHWRPDSLGDALPQLCGGSRFAETPGKLPRFQWRSSHSIAHLSSDRQVPRRAHLDGVRGCLQAVAAKRRYSVLRDVRRA